MMEVNGSISLLKNNRMEYIKLNNGVEMPMVGFGTFPLTGEKLVDCLKITSSCDMNYMILQDNILMRVILDIV